MQAHYTLTGQKVLVTGGGSGIGLATATLMAQQGAQVCINHLDHDERAQAAVKHLQEQGLEVFASPGDVGHPEGAAAMVDRALRHMGGLSLLVNNAGTPGTTKKIEPHDIDLVDEALWRRKAPSSISPPPQAWDKWAAAWPMAPQKPALSI